jgi:hypothetical protein
MMFGSLYWLGVNENEVSDLFFLGPSSLRGHGWLLNSVYINLYRLLVLGLWIGLCWFWAHRLFVFAALLLIQPSRTLREIPAIWVIRQFESSVIGPIELVPGYPLRWSEIQKMFPRPTKKEFWPFGPFQVVLIAVARISFFLACILSRVIFKLSAPFLVLLAYVARPLSTQLGSLRRFAFAQHRASLRFVPLILSVVAILTVMGKALLMLKAPHLLCEPQANDHLARLAAPHQVTLWQVTAFFSACLFIAAMALTDKEVARKQMPDDSREFRPTVLRTIAALTHMRALLATFSIVCILIWALPVLNKSGLLLGIVEYPLFEVSANAECSRWS